MPKFSCAVVGLGNIGLLYDLAHDQDYILTHAKAYLEHPWCDLLFGIDIDRRKRKLFNQYTKKPSFRTIKEAKKAFDAVDILSICVPVAGRLDVISQALALHPKAILLEKPIARNSREAREIIRLCKKNNVSLSINYLRRFEGNTAFIKNAVRGGRFGKFLYATVAYNRGFFTNASHYIDMFLYILGRPKSVKLVSKVKTGNDLDVDFDLFYPGSHVSFKSLKTDVPIGELDFWFEKAKIEYKRFGKDVMFFGVKKDGVFRKFGELAFKSKLESELPRVMYNVINGVCRSLKEKSASVSGGQDALATLSLCEHIVKKS